MKIDISIIVPVYNLEQYLSKCVNAILSQTFTNFELILVNDGSTDKSGARCEEYARQDSRVKVVHKKNGGVASARNTGLEIAKGKYIGFVDNDDYIHEHMYEVLYNMAITYASDIVICDYEQVDDQNINPLISDLNGQIQHFDSIKALHQLYQPNYVSFVVPWNKLYRRELFNQVKYKIGFINDDETVAHKLLYDSKKTTYIHQTLYYYVQRENSQMNVPFHIDKLGAVYALKDREVFFKDKKMKSLHQKALRHYMEVFFWYYYLAKAELKDIDHELKKLKQTFNKTLFHLLRHNEIGWKQKIMCVVFRVSPTLFEYIRDTEKKPNKHKSRI